VEREQIGHETYVYEQIEYWIDLYAIDGRYHAEWTCMRCNAKGATSIGSITKVDAIARAKRHLAQSIHATAHLGS
jgi:hypothetical protein